jgi:hypothetical protein
MNPSSSSGFSARKPKQVSAKAVTDSAAFSERGKAGLIWCFVRILMLAQDGGKAKGR